MEKKTNIPDGGMLMLIEEKYESISKNKKGIFVEVVADKNRATQVELKDAKDTKDTIYSMNPYIGIITTEVAK